MSNTPLQEAETQELRKQLKKWTYRTAVYIGSGGNDDEHIETVIDLMMSDVAVANAKQLERASLDARIAQLDQLIDINGQTFNRWTQKDIAHFFEVVGKQYRKLEKQRDSL